MCWGGVDDVNWNLEGVKLLSLVGGGSYEVIVFLFKVSGNFLGEEELGIFF